VLNRLGRWIRGIFESIAYAGLRPGAPAAPKQNRWLGPLSRPFERLLAGGSKPTDPLYLTNRTIGQKIRMAVLLGTPCLVMGGLVYGMLTGAFDFGPPPPAHEATGSELAAKLLPHMDPNIHIATDKAVEVVEVRVERGPQMYLMGRMRNTTNHEIAVAEVVFDLTDSGGSQLGGVSARIEEFKPRSIASFRIPIEQATARFALVREIHAK
jgi:hypothetical protein